MSTSGGLRPEIDTGRRGGDSNSRYANKTHNGFRDLRSQAVSCGLLRSRAVSGGLAGTFPIWLCRAKSGRPEPDTPLRIEFSDLGFC